MSESDYRDIDVPFCARCSRFMVKRVGQIWIALNHEKDKDYFIRTGIGFKCPQCGCIVISKWKYKFWVNEPLTHELWKDLEYWKIYLEDHKHINKFHALQ